MKKLTIFILCVLLTSNVNADIFKKLSKSLNLKGQKDLETAETYFENENYIQAITFYLNFLKKNEINQDISYKLAVCYFETQNLTQGYPYIEKISDDSPDNTRYLLLKAEYLISMGQLENAIATYNSIVKISSDDYFSFIRLGELYVERGDITKARSCWENAVKIDPSKTYAYSLLSESYIKVDNNKLKAYFYARKLYDYSAETDKPGIDRMLNSISGDFRNEFENSYRLFVCIDNAKKSIATLAYQKAYQELKECETLPNINSEFLMLLSSVCEKLGKLTEAADCLNKCIAIGIENGPIYYNLGTIYKELNKLSEAEHAFSNAAKYDGTRQKAIDALELLK